MRSNAKLYENNAMLLKVRFW